MRATNLPAQVNELIGRTREIAAVIALLGQTRVVTLTGPGGTGKTRLALQVGSEVMDRYADGVWFVDLSPVSDPDQIAAVITHVLGIPELPDRPIRDAVLGWLRERQTLIILDNCEQLIEGAARLVAELLRSASKLTILATSRIPLRIAAEHEYAVDPLGVPNLDALPSLEQLSQYDAVALFIRRAAAVRADFTITDQNAPAVAEICARLDGLPLAIELAAPRIRLFPPQQLLSRLISARFHTLTGGARDLPARQQTIRATIDWSYRLLAREEQALFARLGVFAGGWTLAAAEDVCAGGEIVVATVADLLETLTAHSLVQVTTDTDEPRFAMLETVREFAREQLAAQGELPRLQTAHAAYFLALAETAEPKLRSGDQLMWLDRLDADWENLRATLVWAEDAAPAERALGLRLAVALWYYWFLRGRFEQSQRWLESSWNADAALAPDLRARAHLSAAFGAVLTGHHNHAWTHIAVGKTLAPLTGDPYVVAFAAILDTGQKTAHLNSVTLAEQAGDQWLCALAWTGLQHQGWMDAELEQGSAMVATGLHLARLTGDRWLIAHALWLTGRIAGLRYQTDIVRSTQHEGIRLREQLHDWLGIAYHRIDLARAAHAEGILAEERTCWEERLRIEEMLANPVGIATSLRALSYFELQQDLYTAAHEKISRAIGILEALGEESRDISAY